MIHSTLSLVLAAGDDGLGKLIFGVIFAVIWAISAVVSAMNKKAEEAKRRAAMDPGAAVERARANAALAEAIRDRLPPVEVKSPRRTKNVRNRPAPRQAQRQSPPQRKPQKRPAPPPPLPQASNRAILLPAEQEQTNVLVATQPVMTASIARQPATVGAPAIRRWLTPATLRQQFILTELLQPPKALRPDDMSW